MAIMVSKKIEKFRKTVWDFYDKNKRVFPWRETSDPYKILVSEMMLQQTQADRVVRYYETFIKKFPTVEKLAKASFQEIYEVWQGLGYNRRAMFLKKMAEAVVGEYGGKLPTDPELLRKLPGLGPYTSKAVAIFSSNYPAACIETNIRRVFIHELFKDKKDITDELIMRQAELALPEGRSREWHWALMDYGAYLKGVTENPNRRHKQYAVQSKFEGSLRQARGAALKILSAKPMTAQQLAKISNIELERMQKALINLKTEGLVTEQEKTKLFSLL